MCAVDQPSAAAGQIYNCGDERQLTLRQLAEIVAHTLGHRWEIECLPAELAMPSWPLASSHEAAWHRMVDISKIRSELGYRDVISAPDAMAETVRWYAERRSQLAKEIEQRLDDPFDYAAEDRLLADWRRCQRVLLARHYRADPVRPHAYAHPKAPSLGLDHRGR
jgi:dTDP-D-glucose 4,6-dehydratase